MMKKFGKLLSIILLFCLLGLTFFIIYHVNSSLDSLDNYDVYATQFQADIAVKDNGDVDVTYQFDTHINESFSVRYFTFTDSHGDLDMIMHSLLIDGQPYHQSLTRAPLDDMNPSDYYNEYYFGYEEGRYIVEYYFPRNENFDQDVEIKFTFENFVKVHQDFGDLYYTIAQNFDMPFINFDVDVSLPTPVPPNELYAYGYGPVQGVISEDKLHFSTKDLDVNERFEIRLLMPSEIFVNATKDDATILAGVIAENDYYLRMKEINRYLIDIGIIASFAIMLFSFLYAWVLKLRFPRLKGYNEGSINHIPQNIDYLLSGKLIQFYRFDNNNDLFSASILELARRKIISFEEDVNAKGVSLQYRLLNPEDSSLQPFEQNLLDFLFGTISNGHLVVTTKDIEKYGKKNPTQFATAMKSIYEGYKHHFDSQKWEDDEMKKHNSSRFMPLILNFIMMAVGVIIVITQPLLNNALFFIFGGVVSLILSSIGIIILSGFYFRRLNEKGEGKYAEIYDFYQYLNHYTLLKEKDVQDLVMWESYLVYATAFGIADKVVKNLQQKFSDLPDQTYYHHSYLYTFYLLNIHGISPTKAIQSINVTFTPSHYTSGGSGGGFSAGGGGGSGGGGSGGR